VIAHGRIEFHGAGEDEGLLPARHDAGGGGGHLRRPVQAAHAAGAAPHRLLAQGLRLAHGVAPPGPTHHLRPQVAQQHAADAAADGDPRAPHVLPGVPTAGHGARSCACGGR